MQAGGGGVQHGTREHRGTDARRLQYVRRGADGLRARRKQLKALLSQRRLPPEGWDDASIRLLLQDAALMDANNFLEAVGVGEREGRVHSALVHSREHS